jgi:tetratricopeptide (TPR) repeat protein
MRLFLRAGLVIMLGLSVSTWCIDTQPSQLDRYIVLYENGEYQKSIDSLNHLLPQLTEQNEPFAITVYKYLGFSYVMTDKIDSAKVAFRELLARNPEATLNPVMIPPNIISVFREVKLEKELEQQQKKTSKTTYWIIGGAAAVVTGGLLFILTRSGPEEETKPTGGVGGTW